MLYVTRLETCGERMEKAKILLLNFFLFFFYNFNHRLVLVKAMIDLCHFGPPEALIVA